MTRRPRPSEPRRGGAAAELPEDLLAVLRRMRLPYLRNAAPRCSRPPARNAGTPPRCCGCSSPRRSRGRDDATRRMRRKAAGLPRRQDLRLLA